MVKKDLCKGLTFEDCELAILRNAIDVADRIKGKTKMNSPEIRKIITIVENFIRRKSLICYGGTAINNILPKDDQFYDKDIEIPDYDFFSPTPLEDAKELANIYYKAGFDEVEAKSGMHFGTFKVFVNFTPIADITLLSNEIYKNIKKEAISVKGILYAPPNYLRMAMYLELSRPNGDVSRWEKVLKRITLLNKHYPLINKNCQNIEFQRPMDTPKDNEEETLYGILKQGLIDQSVVFFGGFANSLYSKYMPRKFGRKIEKLPDFDVLAEDAFEAATVIKERLEYKGFKKISIIRHDKIGEIISEHFELNVAGETLCFFYTPLACHSYNEIYVNNNKIKVATVDTMMSFYLAFLYTNRPYYDKNRILCMSQYLFTVQQKNRLAQKGLLRRFSINCYGEQPTLETMRAEKTAKYEELKDKRDTKEYEMWFLRYVPREISKTNAKPTRNAKSRQDAKGDKTANSAKTVKKRPKKKRKQTRGWKFF
tara:strand:- start:1547 stop:2995 length:1449 start_codon:yes stop_codon:yes gene_type:complete